MLKMRRSKIITGLALTVFLLLALAFPFGPLLPWSPLKLGYNRTSFARADVYLGSAHAPMPDYAQVEQMMREAEAFHGLRFHRRIKVIECKNWADCDRAMPWLNTHGLGGVTLATGDVIYLTPKLREKQFSTAEFLRHELSHALLSQNTTIYSTYKLNEQPWFFEGLAVSFGRQQDYLKRDAFLLQAKQTELLGYLDPAKRATPWNARFAYPAQRYFIEYVKEQLGAERFQQFLEGNIAEPLQWRRNFTAVFGQPFEQVAQAYEQALKAGQWAPAP
jgi:hypothetical protein